MYSISMVLFTFFVCLTISSVFNILFKTTRRWDWAVSILLSAVLALFLVGFMGG
ncbi:hypothetical protein SAMN05421677_105188 [Halobacillus aidingensis]|uniref:Uncharacterized protein n=1 Tax=Halobacillus aidingensis TaxID=240303 RepID=A0A1H0K1L9_HALAD|nr:hypothetical protein SAMN05421677_105188 [Halobacillus aidingensis]